MPVISDLLRRLRPSEVLVPRLLLLGGILGTLGIVVALPADVFYSGDGGVKWLLVRQYLAGDFGVDLRLPASEFVQRLWQDGHYPFKPPFVYDQGGRWVVSFSPLFSLLTTPFVGLLGFKGVYVIPLLSLYGVWFWCYRLARRVDLGGWSLSLWLAALIVASPLTIYGAMFWEHTLGVLLCLAAVAWLASTTQPGGVTCRTSALLGFVFGLAPWIRSEAYCMWVVFCALSLSAPQLRRRRQTRWFVGASLAAVLLLWLNNGLLYGHPLGAHSVQVVEALGVSERLQRIGFVLPYMTRSLLEFFPPTWLFLCGPLAWWFSSRSPRLFEMKVTLSDKILWATAVLSVVGISLIVPNTGGRQHGPRYLLILLPLIALLAARIFDALWRSRQATVRWGALVVALVLVLAGAQRNSCAGVARLLDESRNRSAPALQLLRRSESPIVLVSHQHVAQELAAAMPDKAFVRLTTRTIPPGLARQLSEAGHRDLLLVSRRSDALARSRRDASSDDDAAIDIRLVGDFGLYRVHRIRLPRRTNEE